MALEAAAHPRQLVDGGEFERGDRTVAAVAGDALGRVERVIEAQVGRWDRDTRDALPVPFAIAEVAVAALSAELGPGGDDGASMIRAVAAVAAGARGEQRVGAPLARARALVTGRAGRAEADMEAVVEADAE